MSTTLAVPGRTIVTLKADSVILLGSDSGCTIAFPDDLNIRPRHAVVKAVEGRWIIESLDDSVFIIGDSSTKQSHWLKRGDEIRLSEDCPPIVFQPIDDVVPILDDVIPLSDDLSPSLSDTRHNLLSETTPFLPVSEPTSSAEPVVTSPFSNTNQAQKSQSSATIRVPKSMSSGSMRIPKSPSSAAIRATDGTAPSKSQRSDPGLRTSNKLSRSRSQNPAINSDEDEPAGLPTLTRLSSYEDEFPDLPMSRPRKQSDDMQWIMMVVGRSVVAGLIILVLLIAISSLRKSFSPMQIESSPMRGDTNNQPTHMFECSNTVCVALNRA